MIVPNKLNDMYLKNMADSKFSLNTNATTYYYCGYKMAMGNVIMGEIKSFKTK